jgi:hypothetical protein
MYDVAYFMASTDTVEDNTKFAKATSVTLQGRGGGRQPLWTRRKRISRCSPIRTRKCREVRVRWPRPGRQPVDVLHRQERQDLLHREGGQAGDVG